MNKKMIYVALLLALGTAQAQAKRYIVKLTDSAYAASLETKTGKMTAQSSVGLQSKFSRTLNAKVSVIRAMSGKSVVIETGSNDQDIKALLEMDTVEYVEEDRRMYPTLTPSDPRFNEQFSLATPSTVTAGINAESAWDTATGSGVVVAIVDTGILKSHEEFQGQLVPGYDFVRDIISAHDGDGRDNDASDPGNYRRVNECIFKPNRRDSSWHGSHVAGIVAAAKNGLGITGVAYDAKILPVRVLGACDGFTSDIVDAGRWAAGLEVPGVPHNANPAKVINFSLGGEGSCSRAEQEALDEVYAAGVLVVASAGNDNHLASKNAPANCNHVLAVAAVDKNGVRSGYSNYGATVDISTAGGDYYVDTEILSTVDSSMTSPVGDSAYVAYEGTSQAAPHIAGIAALLYEKNPGLTVDEVTALLKDSARDFPPASGLPTYDCTTTKCGSGLADASAALSSTPDFVADTSPDSFSFANKSDIAIGSAVSSETIRISGFNTAVPVSVSNGEYKIGTGAYTSASGMLKQWDTITVRHTASAQSNTEKMTTLSVGGVSTTFSSTTKTAPISPPTPTPTPTPSGGGGGGSFSWALLWLAIPLFVRRKRVLP